MQIHEIHDLIQKADHGGSAGALNALGIMEQMNVKMAELEQRIEAHQALIKMLVEKTDWGDVK